MDEIAKEVSFVSRPTGPHQGLISNSAPGIVLTLCHHDTCSRNLNLYNMLWFCWIPLDIPLDKGFRLKVCISYT